MIIHLIDGTYELFRHFYGQRSYNKGKDKTFRSGDRCAAWGVLEMIEDGMVQNPFNIIPISNS